MTKPIPFVNALQRYQVYLPKVHLRWIFLDQVKVLNCLTTVSVILNTALTNKVDDIGV